MTSLLVFRMCIAYVFTCVLIMCLCVCINYMCIPSETKLSKINLFWIDI